MFLLVVGGLLEKGGDLFIALFPGDTGVECVLVPSLRFTGESVSQVLFRSRAF